MSTNVFNNSMLATGWQNSILWKGSSWQNVVGTGVLNNPGQDSNQPQPFISVCSSRHPKQRPKRPRPQRGWRREIMPPKQGGRQDGRYNGKGAYRSVDDIPNGTTILQGGIWVGTRRPVQSKTADEYCLHTTWSSSPGPGVTPGYLKNQEKCKISRVPQVVRLDPYSFTTQEYLRTRRRLFSQNTSNRPSNGCFPVCSKTGQNATSAETLSGRVLPRTNPAPLPVVKPLFPNSSSYPVPATYRPGKIGGVSSAARTFALKLQAQKHNPVFPAEKATPFVSHIKPGNKLKCDYSPHPNMRAPVGFFSQTSSVLG